jgi:hypothetical protein
MFSSTLSRGFFSFAQRKKTGKAHKTSQYAHELDINIPGLLFLRLNNSGECYFCSSIILIRIGIIQLADPKKRKMTGKCRTHYKYALIINT